MSGILFNNITEINPQTIKKIISESAERREEMRKLYERYKGTKDGVPILTRKYKIDNEEQQGKINNKLANDFFSEITDMKVGFLCGVPISYVLDKELYAEAVYDKNMKVIQDFNKQNTIPDVDAECAKIATICGITGKLFYYEDAKPRIKIVKPWELAFIGETVEAPEITLRIREREEIDAKGKEIEVYCVDVYDSLYVTYYEKKDKEEDYKQIKQEAHLMPYNPLIGLTNNDEMIGDSEKVLTLIDGYDKTVSDINSELEQFRLAYLAVKGADITREILEQVKQTGAFSLPIDSDMSFVTKDINDAIIEHHLDRVEANIYRFSKTPNMNDISFSGDLSGVAMKYKFKSFEDKCKTAELKFQKSLIQQYKILTEIWKKQGVSINYLDMDFVFTRNYPQNLMEEIQFLQTSKGLITEETAFSLVSFITNPEKEASALEEQKQANIDEMLANSQVVNERDDPQQNKLVKGENVQK